MGQVQSWQSTWEPSHLSWGLPSVVSAAPITDPPPRLHLASAHLPSPAHVSPHLEPLIVYFFSPRMALFSFHGKPTFIPSPLGSSVLSSALSSANSCHGVAGPPLLPPRCLCLCCPLLRHVSHFVLLAAFH